MMAEFGQCSDSSCAETPVRLFECAHHCMKPVCLQHLIEHDRIIGHSQQHSENLRLELEQLWTTYSSLVDETKLHMEFEQKLRKHRELTGDVANILNNNSTNIEQYQVILEKLKQTIQSSQDEESSSRAELIKIEPVDEINSSNVSMAIDPERSTDTFEFQQQNISLNDRRSLRKLSGECPFTVDGAFGLTEAIHGINTCPSRKSYLQLFRHLLKYHKLKLSSVEKICRALRDKVNPSKTNLFRSTDVVIDHFNHLECPFSIHNKTATKMAVPSKRQRQCRSKKAQFGSILRFHLTDFHRMTVPDATKLVQKLKLTLQNTVQP